MEAARERGENLKADGAVFVEIESRMHLCGVLVRQLHQLQAVLELLARELAILVGVELVEDLPYLLVLHDPASFPPLFL